MKWHVRSGAAFIAPLIIGLGVGTAQAQDSSQFLRDRNIGVIDRKHPELDPLGIPLGSFTILPSVTTSLTYDNNIYAQDVDRRADGVVTIQPSMSMLSDWSRNALRLDASLSRDQYLSAGTESRTNYSVDANGRLDIAEGNISVAMSSDSLTQARTAIDAPDAARRPIRYHNSAVGLQATREFAKFRLLAALNWHGFRYDNAMAMNGLPLNQTYRNRNTTIGEGRIDFAVTPAISIYADATVNVRDYLDHLSASGRDSHGYSAEGGSDFDITHLVRGHIQFGYLSQISRIRTWTAKGFSGRGKIEWFMTPVFTVTIAGGRSIEDSALSESSAYSSTDMSVRTDYELLRSIILSATAEVAHDHFEGIDQNARQTIFGAEAKYRMGRHAIIDLSYRRVAQRTAMDSLLRRFTDDRVTLFFRVQI